jgi:hypothetical protein
MVLETGKHYDVKAVAIFARTSDDCRLFHFPDLERSMTDRQGIGTLPGLPQSSLTKGDDPRCFYIQTWLMKLAFVENMSHLSENYWFTSVFV